MRYSLAVANGCIEGPEHFDWVHNNNDTFRASLRELACAPFTFVVLRDPLQRLASVYLDKIVARQPQAWGILDILDDGTEPDDLTFRTFVDALKRPRTLAADIHWRPQTDFLVYEAYDAYISLDDLAKASPMLAERAGLEIRDARSFSLHGNEIYDTVEKGVYADLSPADIRTLRSEGKTIDHLDLYDDALRKSAKRLYSKDIDIYEAKFGEIPPSLQ